MQQENKVLKKHWLKSQVEVERARRLVERLEGWLRQEGMNEEQASRIGALAKAPVMLRLEVTGEAEECKEFEVRTGHELPAVTVRLKGTDALFEPHEYAVRVRAVQGSHLVGGVLEGSLTEPIDEHARTATFRALKFVKTSHQCNDLPFGLVFFLVQKGVALEPSIQVTKRGEYHVRR